MPTTHHRLRLVTPLLCACVVGHAAPAAPFAIAVHERIALATFAGDPRMQRPLPAITSAELARFWTWARAKALEGMRGSDPERLTHGLPLEQGGTKGAPPVVALGPLKRALSLNVQTNIFGIDRAVDAGTLVELLARASAHPDIDERDRNRLARAADGTPMRDRFGGEVPDDPATLNMGKLRGLSSQASAHYGLLPGPHTTDAASLERDPKRFALATAPGQTEVLTFAPERAQLYAELAALASLWPEASAPALAALFTGHGWHYLQDVGSQVHTVQVGLYDFFFRAKLLYWKRAALTFGGYLGELRPFTSIGIDLIANHHVWIEGLGAKRILEAARGAGGPLADALAGLSRDDPELRQHIDDHQYARALVRAVIDRSAPEGPALYRAAIASTVDALRSYGVALRDEADDADRYTRAGADLEPVYSFIRKGLARVATAMRRWWAAHERVSAAASRDRESSARALAARIFSRLLSEREGVRKRRAAYLEAVTPARSTALREPVWIAIDLGAIFALAALAFGLWKLGRRLRRGRVTPSARA